MFGFPASFWMIIAIASFAIGILGAMVSAPVFDISGIKPGTIVICISMGFLLISAMALGFKYKSPEKITYLDCAEIKVNKVTIDDNLIKDAIEEYFSKMPIEEKYRLLTIGK